MTWDRKTINTARSMWERGITAREIGETIGKSRNAVIGMMRRIGSQCGGAKRAKTEKDPKPQAPIKQDFINLPINFSTMEPKAMITETLRDDRVSMLDVKEHHCREIMSEPHKVPAIFCGKKISRLSYCHEHAAKNYTEGKRHAFSN